MVRQTEFFKIGLTTNLREGKLNLKPVLLHLKTDVVSHPAHAGGVGYKKTPEPHPPTQL